jgi:hypothetical protein
MPNYQGSGASGSKGGPDDGPQVSACVKRVLDRFPHVQSASLRLLERNESFRELCEEYEACAAATERLAATEAIRKEYEALRLRLEGELLRYIADFGGGGTTR